MRKKKSPSPAVRQQRHKIIKKKSFHKIWEAADKTDDTKEYIAHFLSEGDPARLSACNLDYVEKLEFLHDVYRLSHLSFYDILSQNGITKAGVSDMLCIPIRTVEDWYSGENACASYIRLAVLRQYHLLKFRNRYIRIEADVEHEKNAPRVYASHLADKKRREDAKRESFDPSFDGYEPYREHKRERSREEKEFFKRYGFYPEPNISLAKPVR